MNSRFALSLRALVVGLVLALGVTACGGDSKESQKEDAKAAADALDKGLAAHATGDLETAKQQYDKVLELDPTNKYAFYNLALIDVNDGNFGLAQTHYESALKSDPKYVPALFNLAILVTANDPKRAITLYQRAVKAQPDYAGAWLNLGLLLRADGQTRAGNKAVAKAIGLDRSLKDPEKPAGAATTNP